MYVCKCFPIITVALMTLRFFYWTSVIDVLDGFSSSPRSSPFVGGEEAVTNQYGVDDKVDFSSGLASCVNTLTSVSFHPRDKPGICNHARKHSLS